MSDNMDFCMTKAAILDSCIRPPYDLKACLQKGRCAKNHCSYCILQWQYLILNGHFKAKRVNSPVP